jgi:hypothetical protein
MKTPLKVLLGLLALSVLLGGFWVYRNLSQQPAEVVQQQPVNQPPPESQSLGGGEFIDADSIHQANGRVDIVESENGPLAVFKDFSVTQGPDLFVYLSPNPPGQDLGNFVSLGELKSNSGAQSYNLPANWRDYQTIVIWCRAFSTDFGYASLN